MIHEMSVPPDEKAAAEAIYRHLVGVIDDLDPAHEAKRIAHIACCAARPKMWLRLVDENEELRKEVDILRAHLVSGLCPKCGMSNV